MKTETTDTSCDKDLVLSQTDQSHDQHQHEDDDPELRKGPWTLEEDTLLIHYVACHGEGRWNLLAKSAGLKRTGKSCRLRWLNYLKPDIKRGNLSPQEQLLILELHSKWGNRWSKIAAHLPGRTDNEIKNYWRTRVQKQAKQLNMESNSQSFIDAIRCYYMPRLVQKIEQNSANSTINISSSSTVLSVVSCMDTTPSKLSDLKDCSSSNTSFSSIPDQNTSVSPAYANTVLDNIHSMHNSSEYDMDLTSTSASASPFPVCHVDGTHWMNDDLAEDGLWNLDELWQFRK